MKNLDAVREFVHNYVPNIVIFQKLVAYARIRDLSKNDYNEIEKRVLNGKFRDDPAFRSDIVKECFEKWPEKAGLIRKIAQQKLPLAADYMGG